MQVYVFVENTIQQKMLQQKVVEKSAMFHLYNLILFYSIEKIKSVIFWKEASVWREGKTQAHL